jgi:hypothetical protein
MQCVYMWELGLVASSAMLLINRFDNQAPLPDPLLINPPAVIAGVACSATGHSKNAVSNGSGRVRAASMPLPGSPAAPRATAEVLRLGFWEGLSLTGQAAQRAPPNQSPDMTAARTLPWLAVLLLL